MTNPHRVEETGDEIDPRRARSRDRLLDAATELLMAGGIDAVTVEAVTRRSKVARTTLYRNFGNSTELLAAAFERLIPQVEPGPEKGSLRERLVELLARKSVVINQVPMQQTLFAWLGMSPTTPPEDAGPDAESPAVHSLRTRVIEHYRRPFDQVLASAEARTELGEVDPTFAAAQLIGPILFLRLTGLRPVTPADCEHIVDDFLTVHSRR
jgi:TetR/AcrR family transcriptional regulator of autoinduction and epiphytic fitness